MTEMSFLGRPSPGSERVHRNAPASKNSKHTKKNNYRNDYDNPPC